MRSLAIFTLLLIATPSAHAQSALPSHSLCTLPPDCAPRPSVSDAPPGFALEDWSPRYASGRAHLFTLVPMALGSVLLRIRSAQSDDPSLGDPLALTALGLAGTGAIIGPSMGMWCLGGDCARRSWLPLGLRVAGVGGIAGAWWWLDREIDQADGLGGVGLIAIAPLVLLPGALALVAGIGWSFRSTPRARCGSMVGGPTLSIAPSTPIDGGSGLALRLTL
jgi:hypothetical protein